MLECSPTGASLELGEFAQRIAAAEHRRRGEGDSAGGEGWPRAESPGGEVLQRVFALVDTAALTQMLERHRSQWREGCLMRVFGSHL